MNTIAIFKIIFRGWWRNKLFILISLISLTVGLGCTNLLVTFFIHEYNIEQQTPDRHLIFALRQDSPMEEGVKVSYNGYYGLQTPSKTLDLLNGPEAMAFQNEYAAYYGRPNPFKDPSTISDTNWQDYIFRSSAPITDHNKCIPFHER